MKTIALNIIKAYQFFSKHIYPSGRVCVFTPTCSEYTHEAIKKYGIIKGATKGASRILKCHPKQKKHYDPLV